MHCGSRASDLIIIKINLNSSLSIFYGIASSSFSPYLRVYSPPILYSLPILSSISEFLLDTLSQLLLSPGLARNSCPLKSQPHSYSSRGGPLAISIFKHLLPILVNYFYNKVTLIPLSSQCSLNLCFSSSDFIVLVSSSLYSLSCQPAQPSSI